MFKAVTVKIYEADLPTRPNTRRRPRRVFLDMASPDDPAPIVINGKMLLFIAADKRALRVIKRALRVLANSTTNPAVFDPVADKDEIDAVNDVDDDARITFDIVSAADNS